MTEEIINFGAGPAKLPREVLLKIQKELLNYDSTGISVLEMSHRSSTYGQIQNKTISIFKELLKVPDNYKILLMHGGGRAAFDAVAQNLISKTGTADYLVTGSWSSIAAKDAEKHGKINYILPKLQKGENIPKVSAWKLNDNASYLYYCANETIEGFELPFVPEIENVPLVCDMTSNILTKEIEVSKYGVIFAAAQKNMGTAGVAVVVVREDLLGYAVPECPSILNFSVLAKSNSLLNTPPCFVVYVCCKILEYIEQEGGIKEMQRLSKIKSEILYNLIDDSNNFYVNEVHPSCRSRMNVTFRIKGGDEDMEKKFLKLAEEFGMIQLKGHRSVGGIRASLYNGVTVEDVAKLVGFMRLFESECSFQLAGDQNGKL